MSTSSAIPRMRVFIPEVDREHCSEIPPPYQVFPDFGENLTCGNQVVLPGETWEPAWILNIRLIPTPGNQRSYGKG